MSDAIFILIGVMNRMRNITYFLLLIAIISISACNTFKVRKTMEALENAITNYNVALRWGMHKEAYSYHYSSDGKQYLADLNVLEEISVTGIEVTEKTVNPEHTEAYVETTISYYFKTEGNIKKINLNQKWWLNKDLNQWFIDQPFPKFE